MPRGGKRPGAGAPRPVLSPAPAGVEGGNLNALRTGKHSAQYKRLLEILSRDQEAVHLLEEIALGGQKRAERRRRYAMNVLAQVLKRQEMQTLDRTIDEWERLRSVPTSVLDLPDPATFRSRRKRLDADH